MSSTSIVSRETEESECFSNLNNGKEDRLNHDGSAIVQIYHHTISEISDNRLTEVTSKNDCDATENDSTHVTVATVAIDDDKESGISLSGSQDTIIIDSVESESDYSQRTECTELKNSSSVNSTDSAVSCDSEFNSDWAKGVTKTEGEPRADNLNTDVCDSGTEDISPNTSTRDERTSITVTQFVSMIFRFIC